MPRAEELMGCGWNERTPGAERQPPYMDGLPGVGKTTIGDGALRPERTVAGEESSADVHRPSSLVGQFETLACFRSQPLRALIRKRKCSCFRRGSGDPLWRFEFIDVQIRRDGRRLPATSMRRG